MRLSPTERRRACTGVAEIEMILIVMLLVMLMFLAVGAAQLRLTPQRVTEQAHREAFAEASPSGTDQLMNQVLDLLPDLDLSWPPPPRPREVVFEYEDYDPPAWLDHADFPNDTASAASSGQQRAFAGPEGWLPPVEFDARAGIGGVPEWTWPSRATEMASGLTGDDLPFKQWYEKGVDHCIDSSVESALRLRDEP